MDSHSVIALIDKACHSQNHAVQQEAMRHLQTFEGSAGFIPELLNVLQNHSSVDCKILCLVCLKNSISRCWISRDAKVRIINFEEKSLLRNAVMNLVNESNPKLFIHIAVVIAKIAKFDWPEEWPTLFETLFSFITNSDQVLCINAMKVLLHVLETLSTKTLSKSKAKFSEICIEMFPAMRRVWVDFTSRLFGMLSSSSSTQNVTDPQYYESYGGLVLASIGVMKLISTQIFMSKEPNTNTLNELSLFLNDIVLMVDSFSKLLLQLQSFPSTFTPLGHHPTILVSGGWWENHGKFGATTDAEFVMEETTDFWSTSLLAEVDLNSTASALSCQLGIQVPPQITSLLIPSLVTCRIISEIVSIPRAIMMKSDHLMTLTPSAPCQIYGNVPLEMQFVHIYVTLLSQYSSLPHVAAYDLVFLQKYLEESILMSTVPLVDPLLIQVILFLSKTILDSTTRRAESSSAVYLEQILPSAFQEGSNREISSLFHIIVQRLMCIAPSWVLQWDENPSDLFHAFQASSESDSVRCAAEGLFSSLVHWAPDVTCNLLWNILSDVSGQVDLVSKVASSTTSSAILKEICFWEGIYTCCSFCSYQLGERFNTSSWMMGAIAPLLSNIIRYFEAIPSNSSNVRNFMGLFAYRIVWMLSCWAYTIDASALGGLIGALVQITNCTKSIDILVRLQAIKTLSVVLKVDAFTPDMLFSHIEMLLMNSCLLIRDELDDAETQNIVIELFIDVLDSFGVHIRPFILPLCQYMVQLWGSTTDEESEDLNEDVNIVRPTILDLFTKVVKLTGADESSDISMNVHQIIMPIVAYATCASPGTSHFTRQGMQLWLGLMRNTMHYNQYLKELIDRNLPRILDSDLIGSNIDELKVVLCLLEAYMLVGGMDIIYASNAAVTKLLLKSVGNVRPRAVPYAMRPLEALLVKCGNHGDCIRYLDECGVALVILRACAASVDDVTVALEFDQTHQNVAHVGAGKSGTLTIIANLFKAYKESDIALVAYLGVISRLMLCAPDTMVAIAEKLIVSMGGPSYQNAGMVLIKGIIRLMLDKFDSFNYSSAGFWKRRVCAMCLLSLYPTSDNDLVLWLPEVFYIVDDVLTENSSDEGIAKLSNLPSNILSLSESTLDSLEDEGADEAVACAEEEQIVRLLRNLLQSDVALQTNFHSLLMNKCEQLKGAIGEERMMRDVYMQVEQTTLERLMNNRYQR